MTLNGAKKKVIFGQCDFILPARYAMHTYPWIIYTTFKKINAIVFQKRKHLFTLWSSKVTKTLIMFLKVLF